MVNERTSDAIVIEMAWLHRGQPTKVPYVDDFNRNVFRYVPKETPMNIREARALAVKRAATWAFECPDVPPKPADFDEVPS